MKQFVKRGTALLCGLAFALTLAGCAAPAEKKTYTVGMTSSEGIETAAAVDVLARIRTTVVDVMSYTETGQSAGSGVIIGATEENEYFIVTNHHVIDGGKTFTADVLFLGDEEYTTTYDATLIGSSLKRDIAVLSIRPPAGTKLTAATFIADSDSVKVGTEVFAIGNPLGILGGTVTHGIVSATKRAVNVGEIGTMTLMQTDASINGGNSGGGLFDTKGNLVGIINSGYESYNGQNVEGLNFAIPANDAQYAAKALIETHEEQDGTVTQYGYVAGDAKLDLTFSAATLYTDDTLRERANYLIAAATGSEGAIYAAWGNSAKAIVSVTVNGTRYDFSESGGGSYSLSERANAVMEEVQAGDTVLIEYRNVLSRGVGGFGGFGLTYNYLDGTAQEVTFTASQYIYKP